MTDSLTPRSRAAAIGSAAGFLAWVVALAILLFATTESSVVGRVVPPCLFASLGLWALTTITTEAARSRFGATSREATMALLGSIAFAIGCLLVVVDALVLPVLQTQPDALDVLRSLGATTAVSPWLRSSLLACGAACLAWLAWRWTSRA